MNTILTFIASFLMSLGSAILLSGTIIFFIPQKKLGQLYLVTTSVGISDNSSSPIIKTIASIRESDAKKKWVGAKFIIIGISIGILGAYIAQ